MKIIIFLIQFIKLILKNLKFKFYGFSYSISTNSSLLLYFIFENKKYFNFIFYIII